MVDAETTAKQADKAFTSYYFTWIPLILFFISGFSGLVYEVVWNRMLVLVFGNTTLSTSTILASFMAGLSLGSYFWGKHVDKRKRGTLTTYGCLEISIGLFALIFPLLLRAVTPLEVWLSEVMEASYYLRAVTRAFFCFGLLMVPTFLMGGTFAVIGKHVIQNRWRLGSYTAFLYGVNTAGAVLGAGLAGFFLIKTLGHSGAFSLAAILNILTGGVAIGLDRWKGPHPHYREPEGGFSLVTTGQHKASETEVFLFLRAWHSPGSVHSPMKSSGHVCLS